jgi:hypothetical protein
MHSFARSKNVVSFPNVTKGARKKQVLRFAQDDATFVFHPFWWAAGPCATRDDKRFLFRVEQSPASVC